MIEISLDDAIERKKRHRTFSIVFKFLYERFNEKKEREVYPDDIVKILKVTKQRAWQILTHFHELGFINKKSDGVSTFFTPVKEDGNELLLKKYIHSINEELKKMGLI